ncbi:hypothetical protein CEXT_782551 [Caerostris extrusa]|uniref:Uncharacterized protein n=1 Tax=Caerostris extrusa TaxID=172846 RepID=A0AAV4MGX3_CAEEX|nr:hypothetical protein CEXT_782551 [Caerostris extrusa]
MYTLSKSRANLSDKLAKIGLLPSANPSLLLPFFFQSTASSSMKKGRKKNVPAEEVEQQKKFSLKKTAKQKKEEWAAPSSSFTLMADFGSLEEYPNFATVWALASSPLPPFLVLFFFFFFLQLVCDGRHLRCIPTTIFLLLKQTNEVRIKMKI